MQKQIQVLGERKWWGSDLIMIQNEVWKVLEGWLSQYGQACILSGCLVTPNGGNWDISAGIVLIKDADGNYQYALFAAVIDVVLPGYIVLNTVTTNILYEDANSKPKLVTNTAQFQNAVPGAGVDYVAMTSTGGIDWKEAAGIGRALLAMDVSIATLSTGHAVRFDKDRSEMFDVVDAGAIHITFDFTNAQAGFVTRMRFAFDAGNSLVVDSPVGSHIRKDEGDLGFAPSHNNILYFLYAGINEDGDHEVSYTLKQE